MRTYKPAGDALVSIKISYAKMVAEAGPCGLWPKDLGPSLESGYTENQPYWNLGCANQRNLAAMIDNPADLVQPRGETPAYAARRSVAVDKYRKGDIPSGNYPPDFNTGKISDLGK
jgi:pilus assembly protein CpaD